MPDTVYLDANAVIRYVESDEQDMKSLFMTSRDRRVSLVTGELTLAEALVVPLRRKDGALVAAYEKLLRGDTILKVIPVDSMVLRRSAELRAELGSKGMDAIHCATAALTGCRHVVSSDRRFRTPAGMTRVDIDGASQLGNLP
jgi:predicted nucleic acid-binding protein